MNSDSENLPYSKDQPPARPPQTVPLRMPEDEDDSAPTVVSPGPDAPMEQPVSVRRKVLPVLKRVMTRVSALPTNLSKVTATLNRLRAWALLPVVLGVFFAMTKFGSGLERLSYDLPFLFKPRLSPEEVVIVYMDEGSYRELHQEVDSWDRSLHARLLDRMTRDGAKAVGLDILFGEPRSAQADQELKLAIKRNGHVALTALFDREFVPGLGRREVIKPFDEFLQSAASWGIAEVVRTKDQCVRQYYPNSDQGNNFPSAVAVAAGLQTPASHREGEWLNYYGIEGTIPNISYCAVTNQPPDFFRGKVVFVGNRPKVLNAFEETDEFPTPYSRWNGLNFPGVELAATSFLNIARNESLTRLNPLIELLALVGSGLLLGWGATVLRPLYAGIGAGLIALGAFCAGLFLPWALHVWGDWMVVVAVQVPVALAWKTALVISANRAKPDYSPFFTLDGKQRIPNIPDHTLISRIGSGAYGEVWLAKDAIGLYRAVKFIFRSRYSSPDPFLREFHGLQKYSPISLSHPALVHVLHIGKNERGGYFYYIMEAGDDPAFGPQIQESAYSAKNLSRELVRRQRLPLLECLDLGMHLTTALEYLHGAGLIHRDIKPSNIIYVKRIPKLADIGLVTEITPGGRGATYVGTEGYIPPEGPGTPEGDIYSLGKVLYEAGMGRDRMKYPDLPTSLIQGPGDPDLLRFNQIILKACEADPGRRYHSAAQLRNDLVTLREQVQAAATK